MRNYLHYVIWSSTLGMHEMIVLCLSMQREDIIEHIDGKCHMFPF